MPLTNEQKIINKREYSKAYYSSRVLTAKQRKKKNESNRLCMERKRRKQGVPKRPDTKLWKKANPDKVRANSRRSLLKNKYGMTEADYEALIVKQNGRCAICLTDKPTGRNGKWHIDHCHATKVVRGLLCGPCNQAIGLFRDDQVRIAAALRYLSKGVQS